MLLWFSVLWSGDSRIQPGKQDSLGQKLCNHASALGVEVTCVHAIQSEKCRPHVTAGTRNRFSQAWVSRAANQIDKCIKLLQRHLRSSKGSRLPRNRP